MNGRTENEEGWMSFVARTWRSSPWFGLNEIERCVKHVQVQTKIELLDALFTSQQDDTDCVIEVESSIDANANFRSSLKKFACQAADDTLGILSGLSVSDSIFNGFMICKIYKMEYSLYRVQLSAPPTSASVNSNLTTLHREGFIIALSLDDGSVGFGEVSPLEIHKENLLDAEEQLRFLGRIIGGAKIDYFLPLLKGSFSSWIWNSLGIPPGSICPSVRCGLEMAVLNAIAAREGSSLLNILYLHANKQEKISWKSQNVKICALVDSNGTPKDVAYVATTLAEEGFSAIKLKVARRADPIEDAAVIQEVRKKVGHQIELRADANRKWTYAEAIRFGFAVKNCDLQYIEEPVSDEDDIIKFCEETGLPVALDETLDNIADNHLEVLAKFTHSRIVAVVIKPSIVGGFENAALIARWAQQHGKMAVVSAAFESGLGLLAYIQFSSYVELQNAALCRVMNKEPALSVIHGLGTYRWLKEDVTTEPLKICRNPRSGFVEASIVDAVQLLQKFQINKNVIVRTFTREQVRNYQLSVDSEHFSFSFNIQEIGPSIDNSVLVFLHGLFGTGEDWIPIMKAISGSARCVAIDLPGHGGSKLQKMSDHEAAQEPNWSIEVVGDMLCKLFHQLTNRKVTLVGYSMGARIALYMALKCSDKVQGAVIISGSPGLTDREARKVRCAKDDFRACSLVSYGLEVFLDSWYAGELWSSLRGHPHFKRIVANRLQQDDVHTLAKVLSDSSVGRQLPLWEDLKHCKVPVLLIVGEKDAKFKRIAQDMCSIINSGTWSRDHPAIVEIPNCGHAAHLENPLPVIHAVREFLTTLKEEFVKWQGLCRALQ
ncbi:unnamed protein product [Ilex paraguariensis]|uniref:Mandelate racemase/muconate lactonizing enzyme C-terminal domain-containing protein n=2 Tax=Ilex paraguariensis TaxID=185542 RepID=A0ABC8SFL2_9AQUA